MIRDLYRLKSIFFKIYKYIKYVFKNNLYKKEFKKNNLKNFLLFLKNTYFKKKNIYCYRLYNGRCYEIKPILKNDIKNLLSNGLFQLPKIINFHGKNYDLTNQGVYRFYRLNDISEQRLVSDSNFNSIIKIIGYLYSYGFERKISNFNKPEDLLVHKKILTASCTDISILIKNVLSNYNIESRLITFISSSELNGHDDGHTLLEIKEKDKEWFLYDPSFLLIPLFNGSKISALKMQSINKNQSQNLEFKFLPGNKLNSSFKHSGYDYGFWVDHKNHSKEFFRNWYKNICGTAIFDEEGNQMFYNESKSKSVFNNLKFLGYIQKQKSEIINIFY